MKSLCIVKPAPLVQTSSPDASRLITPDPKEAIIVPNNSSGISFDYYFGASVVFDSFYIGYHTAPKGGGAIAIIQHPNGIGGNVIANLSGNMSLEPLGLGFPYHTFFQLPAPVSTAYIRLVLNANSGGAFTVGTFAVGQSWSSKWGQEMGAGRQVVDTGSAERLFGGGFGIDEGARAAAYQWTFGDLQADEIRSLYQIVKDRGSTRSLLVVEDPEQTDGLNERIHWGLLDKLDFYERSDPTNWRWSLKISDWA